MFRLTAPTWKLRAICGSAVAIIVPSRFSMKNAPAMSVVTYSGERPLFISLVYKRTTFFLPAAISRSINRRKSPLHIRAPSILAGGADVSVRWVIGFTVGLLPVHAIEHESVRRVYRRVKSGAASIGRDSERAGFPAASVHSPFPTPHGPAQRDRSAKAVWLRQADRR